MSTERTGIISVHWSVYHSIGVYGLSKQLGQTCTPSADGNKQDGYPSTTLGKKREVRPR